MLDRLWQCCKRGDPKDLDMGKLCTRADTGGMGACAEAVERGDEVVMSEGTDSVNSDADVCTRVLKVSRKP